MKTRVVGEYQSLPQYNTMRDASVTPNDSRTESSRAGDGISSISPPPARRRDRLVREELRTGNVPCVVIRPFADVEQDEPAARRPLTELRRRDQQAVRVASASRLRDLRHVGHRERQPRTVMRRLDEDREKGQQTKHGHVGTPDAK